MTSMAPETLLRKEALPPTEAPLVFQKIIPEWLGRIASLEGHLDPEEIVFQDRPVGKQALIMAKDV